MKTTKEQVKEIKGLRKEGLSLRKISKALGLNIGVVNYYVNTDKVKAASKKYWAKVPIEKKREIRKRYNPYLARWQREKYAKDEAFREKKKATQKKYYRRKKE